jgi:anti-sigma factor (TIGR02949 family)
MSDKVNCREALAQLQDYLKEELTPESAERIADHLEYCRPCFTHFRYERNFLIMLEAKGGNQCCPEQLRLRILSSLRIFRDSV